MSNEYNVYNAIAKQLKKPFQGFDITTRIMTGSGGRAEISNNPNDYRLIRFDRKFADDHSFPISTIIPYLRETVALLRENAKLNIAKENQSNKDLENKPEVYEFKDKRHIKALTIVSNKENTFEYVHASEKAAIDEIINKISVAMNEANLQIQDQISAIQDKLMVGGIDIDKNSDTLYIFKGDKFVSVSGHIQAKYLKEYLFLISNQWVRNTKIQKVINVKVTKDNYVVTYENQKFSLSKTDGEFTDFEKEVITALKEIFPIA